MITSMTMYVSSCSKDNSTATNTLTLAKTVKGDCSSNVKSSVKAFTTDTVYATKTTDTLSMNVALNLGCCSKFVDSINVTNNVITAYFADTNSSSITCNCICNHSYNFIFIHYTPKTLSYIIKLKSYNTKDYTIYKQGTLN